MRLGCGDRQREAEKCPAAGRFVYPDTSAVRFHGQTAKCQTQADAFARAFAWDAVKHVKNEFAVDGQNTRSLIRHANQDEIGVRFIPMGRNRQTLLLFGEFQRIVQQINQHTGHHIRINVYLRQILFRVHVEVDVPLLQELSQVMRDASICGLGQAAPNPLLSVIKYFPEDMA